MPKLPVISAPRRRIGRRDFDFDSRVAVMAIINRTRDSFFDAGRTFELGAAVEAALRAAELGADIVDIGGVPFSPRARSVTEAEEVDLIAPFVTAVGKHSDVVLSIDTTRSAVAAAAIAEGAAIVNDTSGLSDPALVTLAARTGATVIVTHSLRATGQVRAAPRYSDVVVEVRDFLAERVRRATESGVGMGQLIVDPGPDLNKNTLHTLEICRRFAEFTTIGPPALAAMSNKDFIGEAIDRPIDQRRAGTVATTAWCVERGARLVRAHDVEAAVDAARMTEALLGLRPPAYLRHNMPR